MNNLNEKPFLFISLEQNTGYRLKVKSSHTLKI